MDIPRIEISPPHAKNEYEESGMDFANQHNKLPAHSSPHVEFNAPSIPHRSMQNAAYNSAYDYDYRHRYNTETLLPGF
ncbi:Oidioi.mRNA.OKI2018_I69.PAR.g8592.t1.cds [Oikopleura dioica]|uniref:Oidioi.mRNA.OKI2018_I69.PAR.g8592.t1.cds n=1 Tax=Oikopleura dioica TaxID=34765 RepID=A0ABN7RM12_OIKDI|nr:Oidioi.mRNA.OKI2018_I69.PAR.g8592.t1.cds [Oikopleura dioica]